MTKISFLANKRWPMAVAAGLCTIGLISGCTPPEASGPGSEAVDSAVASALKEEGEVQFTTLGNIEQDIQANLMVAVVNELGGKAEVLQGAVTETMAAASKGQPIVGMAYWRWQTPELWDKYVIREGGVVEVGTTDYPGEEGWYVPTYVLKGDEKRGIAPACPGLPNWEALNECVSTFATAKTGNTGQYMSGAESWAFAYGDPQRIENLDLNYEMVFAGSEAALYADLTRAYEQGKPWLGLMWRPNYMTQKYDLTRVEFPEHTKECWGTTYACQWPETVIYQWGFFRDREGPPSALEDSSELRSEQRSAAGTAGEGDRWRAFSPRCRQGLDAGQPRRVDQLGVKPKGELIAPLIQPVMPYGLQRSSTRL
ncbi:glycine betaine/proline transport system substrate-binding protein [Arthrobacter sp. V1I9]|nr:glycine betaine ABC transporter substrate-binding protein [Arthrobacter sp. V1I9]MDQ0867803.1 glycine betaine/proline transport system substrate-binding protein [Arthrobacter sp. V1I9]